MKSCRELELQLDDFAEGSSTAEERQRVEQHLAGCADCRGVVQETRALLEASAMLARESLPRKDLWPGIRAEIDRGRIATSGQRRQRIVVGTRWLAMAASLMIVAIAGTLWLGQSDPVPSAPGGSGGAVLPAGHDPSATFDQQVQEYVDAAELLETSIRQRRGQLSPETLAVLDRNLEIIDQAIREVRVVLESDAVDGGSVRILHAMHQQKVELLRRVARLSS